MAPEAKTGNPKTREVKRNRDGNPPWTVAVTVRQEGRRISVIEITVGGRLEGIEEGQVVNVTALTAFAWAMGDRHGVSFRADAITERNWRYIGSGHSAGAALLAAGIAEDLAMTRESKQESAAEEWGCGA
ncbi:hypothetical protein EASAB2608_04130 [Streptomyces sp. EAS-AB2608]|nr:hypothetical protein [Streptomyces sp. SID7810]BCM68796.1 hypothetical protein EASAB2608_04130 [Streptomyces sp. EAS-AB2608]CUW30439.1 hypothetical protein TUE45_05166 [Streptomyces reticuli]